MEKLDKELKRTMEEYEERKRKEWENKTPKEKIDYYKEIGVYSRYCDMSIEELEKEKEFNQYMANKLRYSMFGDPYYSPYGCDENVKRINTILKLKKEVK